MILHRAHPKQHASSMRGFSMLEVLIAILVFSLGMIGIAGLMIFAIKSNHVAYLRTQATFLAHSMAARMGANPAGVWGDNYNIAIKPEGYGVPTTCASGCNPADLAEHDWEAWSQQLHTFLPAANAAITCTRAPGLQPNATQVNLRPPYSGTCTMDIQWSESTNDDGRSRQQQQEFNWVFQP